MSSLRNILQRCARKASILGGTPLQIQCTFNPVYSAYPTSISRQAYSSDANEANKNENDPVRKYILEMMNAGKSQPNNAEDQKESKTPIFNKTDSMKSRPSVTEDQKTAKMNAKKSRSKIALEDQRSAKAPIFNKNLNLRKYYITVRGLSPETTPESLREFYSQFGEIAFCDIVFQGEPRQFGSIAFTSREAVSTFLYYNFDPENFQMDRALNSSPHYIDGKKIKHVRPSSLGKKQLTLQVLYLSPKTTHESLKKFYSRFGWVIKININRGIGVVGEVTFANQEDMHRALDAQPHVIDGSEVLLLYAYSFDLDLQIENIPEGVTEETLRAFYSKYGQLRDCQLLKGKTGIPHAFVSFSAISEFNRAMDDRPHIIDGKPLRIRLMGTDHSSIPVSLVVGSLPENVTEETLREEFSKYGKLVFWILKNDGNFNQSGPYGFVSYATEKEALKVLNSGPHTIKGSVVDMNAEKLRSKIPTDQKASKPKIVEDQKAAKVPIFEASNPIFETSTAPTFNKTDSMNSRPNIKSWPSVTEDQKVFKAPTFNKTDFRPRTHQLLNTNRELKFRPNIKSPPNVTEDQTPPKAPTFNKNLNLRKYYITVRNSSTETTPESLREFYSQFGEIAFCNIIFQGEPKQFGSVAFTSRRAMNRALNSLPHCIDGKEINNVRQGILGRKQLTLNVIDLSPKTTNKSLKDFYSRFGMLSNCWLKRATTAEVGQVAEVTFAYQNDMHRALDAQPHVIDGSEVFLKYATFDMDLRIDEVPKFITEDKLIEFYSKYGQLRDCRVVKGKTGIPEAYVSFSAVDEANRAMDDRPHIIHGKPLNIQFLGRGHGSVLVSLFVGSLPENVTEETLGKEFSKYGKPIYWKLENDGDFNQSGPYGNC
ncbi:RNA recognition motif domain-containing protein [Ditylenchus destructor]|nr:RNA recognition motif domain-containing protein [Ditylenchus destructor]